MLNDADDLLNRNVFAHMGKSFLYILAQLISIAVGILVIVFAFYIPSFPNYSQEISNEIIASITLNNQDVTDFLIIIKTIIGVLGMVFFLIAFLIGKIKSKNSLLFESSFRLTEMKDEIAKYNHLF
jgi:uncharacterized membrane protein YesL